MYLVKLVHPCHWLTGHFLKEFTAMSKLQQHPLSFQWKQHQYLRRFIADDKKRIHWMENCHLGNYNLLFEHSSPVILQLINAVLNVTKGAVSTILPAIERCVQQ